MKNIPASIKAKLQNQARAEKIQLNQLLECPAAPLLRLALISKKITPA